MRGGTYAAGARPHCVCCLRPRALAMFGARSHLPQSLGQDVLVVYSVGLPDLGNTWVEVSSPPPPLVGKALTTPNPAASPHMQQRHGQ